MTHSTAPENSPTTRWTRYGFKADPFFVEPLEPDQEALYPITLFRARETEVKQVVDLAISNDRSATLINASGGHGKTTLANRIAYELEGRQFLVPPEEIQLSRDNSALKVFRDLLAGILAALVDDGHKLPEPSRDPGQDVQVELPGLLVARKLVQTIRRTSGSDGGLAILGFSVSGGTQQTFFQPTYEPAASRALLSKVAQEVASLGYQGILIRIDNLDEVARTDVDELDRFLGAARDLFLVPGLHYLLLGDDRVHGVIESVPRIRGAFNLPISLTPFTATDVKEILHARYEHLAIKGNGWIPPVSDELIDRLHTIHYGDLRNILADLGRTVQATMPIEPRPISPEEAIPVLQTAYFEPMARQLTDETWDTLVAIAKRNDPVRQVDLQEELGVTMGTVNQRFQRLEEIGAIELFRRQGASKFYRLTSSAKFTLALAHDLTDDEAYRQLGKQVEEASLGAKHPARRTPTH